MLTEVLLRLSAEVGPSAAWAMMFIAAVIAVFVLYVGVAILATLCAKDPEQSKVRYQIFHDLLGLFDRRRHG
jgi:hypothetical protein